MSTWYNPEYDVVPEEDELEMILVSNDLEQIHQKLKDKKQRFIQTSPEQLERRLYNPKTKKPIFVRYATNAWNQETKTYNSASRKLVAAMLHRVVRDDEEAYHLHFQSYRGKDNKEPAHSWIIKVRVPENANDSKQVRLYIEDKKKKKQLPPLTIKEEPATQEMEWPSSPQQRVRKRKPTTSLE